MVDPIFFSKRVKNTGSKSNLLSDFCNKHTFPIAVCFFRHQILNFGKIVGENCEIFATTIVHPFC